MSNITIFAGNFAPLYYSLCHGQLLSIAENTALFSLLGTTYGGDGQTTFALPDLQGRVPVGTGQGPGLANVDLGDVGGVENVTMLSSNVPAHNHTITGLTLSMNVNNDAGGEASPTGHTLGMSSGQVYNSVKTDPLVTMHPAALMGMTTQAGGSQPISIMQPYLALNYIIAVEGIYPSRN